MHFTFDPEKVIAVLNGDAYTPQKLGHISKLWQTTLHDYFGPSIWNQTGIEGFIVVAVEQNPFQITSEILPRERSGKAGGYYGVVANLIASQISHPKLRLKDQGVKTWLLEPILQPALATI